MPTEPNVDLVKSYLLELQDSICAALESRDTTNFHQDLWKRETGGGGRTRVIEDGQVFEKAGVNFSHVYGDELPAAATNSRPELEGCSFQALGVSIVVHPRNPYIPTSHANVRFFIAEHKDQAPIWWFGGGFDLTPYYGFKEDCLHWHSTAKRACEPLGDSAYPKYKEWCDNYFYLQHRQEARGIGGLFFDDLNQPDFATSFEFMRSIGDHYIPAYTPIVDRRVESSYGDREREFQLYRRGRYVEFNLIYDRGTLFGLQSGGRTESILMSLPPRVEWRYNWEAEAKSAEARLHQDFLTARDWLKD